MRCHDQMQILRSTRSHAARGNAVTARCTKSLNRRSAPKPRYHAARGNKKACAGMTASFFLNRVPWVAYQFAIADRTTRSHALRGNAVTARCAKSLNRRGAPKPCYHAARGNKKMFYGRPRIGDTPLKISKGSGENGGHDSALAIAKGDRNTMSSEWRIKFTEKARQFRSAM